MVIMPSYLKTILIPWKQSTSSAACMKIALAHQLFDYTIVAAVGLLCAEDACSKW